MRKSHVVPLEVKKFLGQIIVLHSSYHQELRVSFCSLSSKRMLKMATLGNISIHSIVRDILLSRLSDPRSDDGLGEV